MDIKILIIKTDHFQYTKQTIKHAIVSGISVYIIHLRELKEHKKNVFLKNTLKTILCPPNTNKHHKKIKGKNGIFI